MSLLQREEVDVGGVHGHGVGLQEQQCIGQFPVRGEFCDVMYKL